MASRILDLIGSEQEFFTLSEATLSARLGLKGRILSDDYRRDILRKAQEEIPFVEDRKSVV